MSKLEDGEDSNEVDERIDIKDSNKHRDESFILCGDGEEPEKNNEKCRGKIDDAFGGTGIVRLRTLDRT